MACVKLTYDIVNCAWNINTSEIGHDFNEIQLWFLSEGDISRDISNLEFGYSLTKDGAELLTAQYPVPPIKYESVKSSLLGSKMIELIPDSQYRIEIYARTVADSEPVAINDYEFTTIKSPRQFASWTWDSSQKQWIPPYPNPDPVNGVDTTRPGQKLYQWSEKRQAWVEGLPEEIIAQDNS